MSAVLQRRRGQEALIYRAVTTEDRRGNPVTAQVEDDPWPVKAWVIPQRSSRAEVAGQQQIDIVRIGCEADLTDVNIWSQVTWRGDRYDVVTPPEYHNGTRHVRHWTMDLRKRP